MTTRDLLAQTLLKGAGPGPFVSLAAAAKLFPGERPGESISPSTVYRWGTKGLPLPDGRVVRLAILRVGRKWVTTPAALAAFIEDQQPSHDEPLPVPRTPAQRRRASEAAARELDNSGVSTS